MPVSAELKLLKFLQERVNKNTLDYDAARPQGQRDNDEAGAAAAALAKKQAHVRELMRKLAIKQNRENDAQEDR